MKKFGVAAILVAFTMLVAGCNTVKGIGQDVTAGGEAIDHAATKVQQKM